MVLPPAFDPKGPSPSPSQEAPRAGKEQGCLRQPKAGGGMVRAHPPYLVIGIWLAGLMLLGVLLAELAGGILPLPQWGVVALILTLSTIKATLVALYYMHLKMDQRLLAFVALTPLLLIALALGVVFSSALVRL